ncbi:MAG: HEAT repeat domain-containing protein [Coriobacteriia bacterium]|nr:HEAT repeat domain-containing protein [Coriobacteriia bacterium]
MERPGGGLATEAEGLLRMIAGAAAAARLYPPTSPLRLEAVGRVVARSAAVTASHGTVQYHVDRARFVVAETTVGEGLPQVAALAETLHALQVGQLIVAPGVTDHEVASLLEIIGGDARAMRASGGVRSALLGADVRAIAVVEVTLRASTEAGLLGLDLTGAPLEEIARELTLAAATWQQDALAGSQSTDIAAEAIGRLESAAQDLAMRRCAEALLHLDEATRVDLLSNALTVDADGRLMDSVLDIIGHMQPAALARLLRLTAQMMARQPETLLREIELPPEIFNELAILLKPTFREDLARGVPPEADAEEISREVARADEEDLAHIGTLVAASTPRSAAARGLATIVSVARERPTEDSIRAVTDALGNAVDVGAFDEVSEAAGLLSELSSDPALAPAIQAARKVLGSPDILRECVRRLTEDPMLGSARTLLEAAGAAGAEALVSGYLDAPADRREHLMPVIVSMAEPVAAVVGRTLRTGDPALAASAIDMLGATGARRLLPTIAVALEHLDSRVRQAAIVALGANPGPDSAAILQKALGHWDPETRRLAAREIGRAGLTDAVPALLRIIAVVNLFERNYELKKEVLKSLEALDSPQAIPVLERLAHRPVAIGKKNRELRYLARRILETLRRGDRADLRGNQQ